MRIFKSLSILAVSILIVTGSSNAVSADPYIQPKPNQTFTTEAVEVQTVEVSHELEKIEDPSKIRREAFLKAALSQVGVYQDCTDLVQNSLAMIGLTTRRDAGGFDYGVQDLAVFGTQIPASEALPGDIAITGPNNGGHIWVILNPATGEGVHGGWNGSTVVGSNGVPIGAHAVYRIN